MVQQMLKEEMGKLGMDGLGAGAAETDMPVNDLGVAKPAAKPLEDGEESDDDELKDKIVLVNDLGVARKKHKAKISIESSAPTNSEKRHLEEPTEEQPKKKQQIE